MRHIRLRGRWEKALDKVVVTVIDRPLHDHLFGNREEEDQEFFFGSQCCIIGYKGVDMLPVPKLNYDDGLLDVCIGEVGSSFNCTLEEWNKIKEGITEFNEWGDTQ